jgi:hypothetical protein
MGIVDVGSRNPAAVAQFSNCRRHRGLGLRALSRSARFNVESIFGFLGDTAGLGRGGKPSDRPRPACCLWVIRV